MSALNVQANHTKVKILRHIEEDRVKEFIWHSCRYDYTYIKISRHIAVNISTQTWRDISTNVSRYRHVRIEVNLTLLLHKCTRRQTITDILLWLLVFLFASKSTWNLLDNYENLQIIHEQSSVMTKKQLVYCESKMGNKLLQIFWLKIQHLFSKISWSFRENLYKKKKELPDEL